jgi:hypothetical protein
VLCDHLAECAAPGDDELCKPDVPFAHWIGFRPANVRRFERAQFVEQRGALRDGLVDAGDYLDLAEP